ncbi:MAG: class I SAM-dependent RNA methyltransferase [Pseudomonadota bacterium]
MDAPSLFLVCPPGLEAVLAEEAAALGLADPRPLPGGVAVAGGLAAARQANLGLRTATRVLLRVATFRALHLAQLDKRARRVDWAAHLRADYPFSVEASCKASRIYHQGAASQRVARAIAEATGATEARGAGPEAALKVMVRIEDDLATLSLDTSGAPLHRRGYKQAIGPAPLRETLAAAFLRLTGYDGREAVVDPMCGSGTFVIEAAEIAAGLAPGRARPFAFESLAVQDPAAWAAERAGPAPSVPEVPGFFGADRDAGAVAMSRENAARAGVAATTRFACHAISDLTPPETAPGLVIVNPPYGARIGERQALGPLYAALGRVLTERFGGWRMALVTSEAGLARATALPFTAPSPPISHGGLKVRLWQTAPLKA